MKPCRQTRPGRTSASGAVSCSRRESYRLTVYLIRVFLVAFVVVVAAFGRRDAVDEVGHPPGELAQDRLLLGLGDVAVGDRLVGFVFASAASAVTSPSTVFGAVTSWASVLPPLSAVRMSFTDVPS